MEVDIEMDLEVCRGCGEKNAEIPLVEYEHMFKLCTGVTVSPSDGLPSNICEKCLDLLTLSYQFKISCQRMDNQLRLLQTAMSRMAHQPVMKSSSEELDFATEVMYELASEETIPESFNAVDDDSLNELSRETANEKYMQNEYLIVQPYQAPSVNSDQLSHDSSAVLQFETTTGNHVKEEEKQLAGYDDKLYVNLCLFEERPPDDDETISLIVLEDAVSTEKPTETENVPNDRSIDPLKPGARFPCDKCRKDFSTKTNLQRHQATHSGIKPYVCDICDNRFTQKSSLKTHRFSHFNIKPFRCSICGQHFTQSKSVTLHMRRHTGEKPFPCDVCKMAFRQKSGLVRHKEQHRRK